MGMVMFVIIIDMLEIIIIVVMLLGLVIIIDCIIEETNVGIIDAIIIEMVFMLVIFCIIDWVDDHDTIIVVVVMLLPDGDMVDAADADAEHPNRTKVTTTNMNVVNLK